MCVCVCVCVIMTLNYYWPAILRLNEALLLAGFRSELYSTDHYHGNGPFPYFSLSPAKFKLSETQKEHITTV